jgi:hypothetical protein
MGCHGTLGRETAKNAHTVDEVANEWDCNNFVNSFGKIVKSQRKIKENIWVCGDKRKSSSCCGEKSDILTQIQKGNGCSRSSESL